MAQQRTTTALTTQQFLEQLLSTQPDSFAGYMRYYLTRGSQSRKESFNCFFNRTNHGPTDQGFLPRLAQAQSDTSAKLLVLVAMREYIVALKDAESQLSFTQRRKGRIFARLLVTWHLKALGKGNIQTSEEEFKDASNRPVKLALIKKEDIVTYLAELQIQYNLFIASIDPNANNLGSGPDQPFTTKHAQQINAIAATIRLLLKKEYQAGAHAEKIVLERQMAVGLITLQTPDDLRNLERLLDESMQIGQSTGQMSRSSDLAALVTQIKRDLPTFPVVVTISTQPQASEQVFTEVATMIAGINRLITTSQRRNKEQLAENVAVTISSILQKITALPLSVPELEGATSTSASVLSKRASAFLLLVQTIVELPTDKISRATLFEQIAVPLAQELVIFINNTAGALPPAVLTTGYLMFERLAKQVCVRQQQIELTSAQVDLLFLLAQPRYVNNGIMPQKDSDLLQRLQTAVRLLSQAPLLIASVTINNPLLRQAMATIVWLGVFADRKNQLDLTQIPSFQTLMAVAKQEPSDSLAVKAALIEFHVVLESEYKQSPAFPCINQVIGQVRAVKHLMVSELAGLLTTATKEFDLLAIEMPATTTPSDAVINGLLAKITNPQQQLHANDLPMVKYLLHLCQTATHQQQEIYVEAWLLPAGVGRTHFARGFSALQWFAQQATAVAAAEQTTLPAPSTHQAVTTALGGGAAAANTNTAVVDRREENPYGQLPDMDEMELRARGATVFPHHNSAPVVTDTETMPGSEEQLPGMHYARGEWWHKMPAPPKPAPTRAAISDQEAGETATKKK